MALGGVAVFALGTAALATNRDSSAEAKKAPCTSSMNELSHAFENVASTIEPSVVRIQASMMPRAVTMRGSDPFFRFPFQAPQMPELPRGFGQGMGTGVVVSEDGYILTNNHVISMADRVTVTLSDDTELEAEVVGTDPRTDLAVLKVDARGLTAARLGSSEELKVGQWVAAMGNPFGLSSTMTSGIISAVGRSRVGLADYENFIQTDAAINPGNSGGPLVNLAGEVIGINTAIFSRSGGYMGIGFAIPVDMARDVLESLIEDGRVERGYLGVMISDLDEELAAEYDFEGTNGALVREASEDGPAGSAGLEAGDIIVRFDGHEVEDVDGLRFQVAKTRPGSTVEVELFRDGESEIREVRVGELPDAPSFDVK